MKGQEITCAKYKVSVLLESAQNCKNGNSKVPRPKFQPANDFSFFRLRLKKVQELGLNYPDNILAFKLLKNCNVSEEAQSTVFAALQSQSDPLVEDMLLRTMNSLKNLFTSDKSEASLKHDQVWQIEIKKMSFSI